jgi:ADP-ribosyl-[dinitrogen reductase] hydrolase
VRTAEARAGATQIDILGDPALDRSIGALVGLAVGDALGAPAEGMGRDTYPRISEFGPSAGPGLRAGEWTDDTAMAICLAESLLERGRVDGGDLMWRFVRWCRAGGIGVSTTTRAVLEAFERTGRLDIAAEAANAGNGCIMRLAPVAIRYRGDRAASREAAAAQARLTHSAVEAVASASMLAEVLTVALESGDRDGIPAATSTFAHPALAGIASGSYRTKARAEISSAPRALDTLEAALWCVARTGAFEAAMIEAVNLGGDTDTIGAVTGQLAGALYGASAIPQRWTAQLQDGARLAELAAGLHRAGGRI